MRFLKLVFLILFTLPLSATTYYLDATSGLNNNDGLTSATAWKDLFKIRQGGGPQPGDIFLFKRGETWAGNQLYITASGSPGNPVRYDAYGTGPSPILSILSPIDTADISANWVLTSANTWSFPLNRTPGRLLLDGVEFLRSRSFDSLGVTDNEGAIGRWFHKDNALYIYSLQNPANTFSEFVGSKFFNTVLIEGAQHLEFYNLDIRGGSGASMSINGGSDILVSSCFLGNTANSGITIIDAVVNSVNTPASRIIVEQCTFDSDFTFFYGLGSERGCGDGIKLFHGANNCIVRDNTFLNWAHNAIELLANIPGRSGVRNNLFHDNTISAPDIPYAHPLGADGLLGLCEFNEFYRNNISDCPTTSQINGNDNWVHHNIIVGMRKSPSKAQATAHAFSLGIYGTNLVSQNNRFDHNLIIDTDESAFLIRGYGIAGQAFGHKIRNNVFYETGLAPYQNEYANGTGIVIYDTNQDGVGPNTYQNNLFYSSTSTDRAVFIQDNNTYFSASDFNTLDGDVGNTMADNIAAAPVFSDFSNGDYFPSNTSPVINAAINTGLALDYNQNPRVIGPNPDIGPYETAVVGLPVNWANFTVRRESPKSLLLEWSTHTESNTRSFIVERSQDALLWQSLKEVPAAGNTTILTSYQYEDRPPGPGIWYYRIRQTDHDDQYSFSRVQSAELEKSLTISLIRIDKHSLQVSALPTPDWSRTTFYLYDTTGRLLMRQRGNPTISIAALPEGALHLLTELPSGTNKTMSFIH